MSSEQVISTRGRIWFEALAGKHAKLVPSVPSVLVADTTLQKDRVRFLAVVRDPGNRFPCARQGQVGLQEGWNLAKQVRDAIQADEKGEKRAIVAIVDVPSQAYGRREELLGIFLAAAAATDAYVSAQAGRASRDLPARRPCHLGRLSDAWRTIEPTAGL